MAEGNNSIALTITVSLLLLSLSGGAAWLAMQQDPVTNEPDEPTDTIPEPEPEPEPEPIECQSDERPIFDSLEERIVGCEPIQPPTNATVGDGDYRVIIGSVTYANLTADGDPAEISNITCDGDGGHVTKFNETRVEFWTVYIGNFDCLIEYGNAAGSTNASLSVEVVDRPPRNLNYSPSANILTKGESFIISPTLTGGEATSWTSTPSLPIGLQLRSDGMIFGAPLILMPASSYEITASNEGGEATTTISLSVLDEPPDSINYLDEEVILKLDTEMFDILPSHGGGEVVAWAIDPTLPNGLSFSSVTGRISGTPTELYERTTHIVYANNSGGFDVTVLHLSVNDHLVTSIDYNNSTEIDLVFGIDSYDTTPATTGGTPTDWAIEPDLPIGLELDNNTGRIWGGADTITPWTNHTIWANNSGGAFSSWLNVRIANMTPTNISWTGGTEHIIAANQSITISAINNGPIIDTWEIEPVLPDGLFFSTTNGTISGSPSGRDGVNISRHAWTEHTIYANNSGGSFATTHTFAIHDLDADNSDLNRRPVGYVDYGTAWPSLILPIGEWAFSLGVDYADKPISSASHAGKGRIVGFGHETMVARSAADDNRANLSLNSLDWVCDGLGNTVGLESSFNGWKNTLLAEGYAVTTSATPADLVNLDCFVTEFWNGYSDTENQQITTWLNGGGGLIMGGHSWYWSYSNSDVAHNYPGNKIAKSTGLFVSASSGSARFIVSEPGWGDLYRLHGSLPLIEDHVNGTQMMTNADATIAATTINLCVGNLPLDYTGVWSSLRSMSNATGWIHIDSNTPYSMNSDEVDDLILNIQEKLMMKLPADEIEAHPSHTSFPGEVNASAAHLTRTVLIDGNFSGLPSQFGYANARSAGRMSTSMYAPAGEIVNITVPASMVGEVGILIGAHTDSLWGKTSLDRHPRIYRSWSVTNTTMQVAAAFGGPIYITIPAGKTLGDFMVTIEDAVAMPHYIHGLTDVGNWQMFLRQSPAPIAELQSDYFILTIPSSGIRNLDYPNETMEFWDEALQMEHNLSGFSLWPRVERAVFDVQISAGWMHSGYPFMAHTASVNGVVNGSYMRQNGDWGMFHELGHNHQWMASTLPGTTEATCNLYSVKLMTDLVGKDLRSGHSALNTATSKTRVEGYFNGGSQISSWSVWTALETYLQIQEEFGWEPITAAYQEYYYNLTTQPSSDSEEFNEWAKWISLKTGRNITAFLAAWGFPITETTQNAVDHLPVWTSDPLRGWVFEYDPVTLFEVASNVTASKADLEWTIYDNGTNTTWLICWGQSDGVTNEANWDTCELLGTNLSAGGAGHPLGGLFSSTDYYWRLTASNGNGQWWDDSTRSFTTF